MPHNGPYGACVCGGEDSDGRGDVLRCPVHGIGEPEVTFTVCGDVPWDEMSPKTQAAIRAVAQAAYDHLRTAAAGSITPPDPAA